jgi:hypothetical protein
MDLKDDSLCFFDNGHKYPYLVRRARRSTESLPEGIKASLSTGGANKLDNFLHKQKRVPIHSDDLSSRKKNNNKTQLETIKEFYSGGVKPSKNRKLQKLIEQAGFDEGLQDIDLEDDEKFLFEEAKFSATSIILQLGKVLDVVTDLLQITSSKQPETSRNNKDSIVLRQGNTDIIWKFNSNHSLTLPERPKKSNGFYPSEAVVDLLNISYQDLIKNTQHRPREWQTHTYKHIVDSTAKGVDSGIFSAPQTAMSGLYLKGDDNPKTTKKTRVRPDLSTSNVNVLRNPSKDSSLTSDIDTLRMRGGKKAKQKTRLEKFNIMGKEGNS